MDFHSFNDNGKGSRETENFYFLVRDSKLEKIFEAMQNKEKLRDVIHSRHQNSSTKRNKILWRHADSNAEASASTFSCGAVRKRFH